MSTFAISDMHVFPLKVAGTSVTLLSADDHLLRRFGKLDLFDLTAGQQTEFELRGEADRFVFVISGRVNATLLDLRDGSPSLGARVNVALAAAEHQGLLVPFGVACSLSAVEDSRIVLLSTHGESHPHDRVATSEELQKYTALQ